MLCRHAIIKDTTLPRATSTPVHWIVLNVSHCGTIFLLIFWSLS